MGVAGQGVSGCEDAVSGLDLDNGAVRRAVRRYGDTGQLYDPKSQEPAGHSDEPAEAP